MGEETHGGVQLRAVGLTEPALATWCAEQALSTEYWAARRFRRLRRAWFDYYAADAHGLPPSDILSQVQSVGEKLGAEQDPFVPVDPEAVIAPSGVSPDPVIDGNW